jgi:hypothetical protein
MSNDNTNEFQDQLEGDKDRVESEAEVSPTTQGSETPREESVSGQPGSEQGDTNPESGNAEQQAEVEGEDRGEPSPEVPAVPAEGSNPETGTNTPAETVSTENEAEETEPVGEDESQGSETLAEDGRKIATDEEKAELKSLESKRKNMPITGDDVARIDYLNTLKHD